MIIKDITYAKIVETDREPPHGATKEKDEVDNLYIDAQKITAYDPSWRRQSSKQRKGCARLGWGCRAGLLPNLPTQRLTEDRR